MTTMTRDGKRWTQDEIDAVERANEHARPRGMALTPERGTSVGAGGALKAKNWFVSLIVIVTVLNCGAQEVSVANGTGYGTTGIYARTFGSVIVQSGSTIKYVPDSVNGDSFLITTAGVYAVSYTDGDPSSDDIGISVNLPSTTDFSAGWGTSQELCGFEVSNTAASCSATSQFSKGTVLRAHSTYGGPPLNSQPIARFIVTKIQ